MDYKNIDLQNKVDSVLGYYVHSLDLFDDLVLCVEVLCRGYPDLFDKIEPWELADEESCRGTLVEPFTIDQRGMNTIKEQFLNFDNSRLNEPGYILVVLRDANSLTSKIVNNPNYSKDDKDFAKISVMIITIALVRYLFSEHPEYAEKIKKLFEAC